MKYVDFEHIMSSARMSRYIKSCNGDTRKAMTLYRKNLNLSQELFTTISCFEIALRNRIDRHYLSFLGNDWLRNASGENGIFDHSKCRYAARIIRAEIEQLQESYSHSKLVAALGFGFWRYLFSPHQYRAGGQTLLQVFSQKPKSSRLQHFNASFIFEQLTKIHQIRNRIAHHEPICFLPSTPKRDTYYVRSHYAIIIKLFRWMDINETALLYGIDHVLKHCHEVDDI